MKDQASTIRPGSTLGEISPCSDIDALERLVAREWATEEMPDLVVAINRHPEVLENRSVLLNLALREYRSYTASSPVDLLEHCQRFRRFGRSVEQSIFRQLETQQYFDKHPDLLAMLVEMEWPELGEIFGDFRLLELLGSGGSARVYLASQETLGDRLVVVKTTPYVSFEASILGRLNHPNIVPIHFADVVEEHQLRFLCMPYCGRSTLADLIDLAFDSGVPARAEVIRRAAVRWLPEAERETVELTRSSRKPGPASYVGGVVKLAIQIADALDHAHQRGIFHGDLKPSNVLLTPDGRPLLLDFNLSGEVSTSGALYGGTLAYMPPEQLRLIAKQEVDADTDVASAAASDIYSFGALLFELLGGRPLVKVPDARDEPDVVARQVLEQLQSPTVSLKSLNPSVTNGLQAIVMQAIAFDASQRPASFDEIKRRLHSELHWSGEVFRISRLHPKLVGTLASLIVVAATTATAWVANRPPAHVALYQQGLAAAEHSNWEEAERALLAALRVNPAYQQARLELGRTYLAANQLDLALSTLEELSIRQKDNPELMELVGYVYNLKRMPSAAIAWYRRSMEHGGDSLSLYNNLAASYLSAIPKLSTMDQLHYQKEFLEKAAKIDNDSKVVTLNLVRHDLAKANFHSRFDPRRAEPYVEKLLPMETKDPAVREVLERWRSAVYAYQEGTNSKENLISVSDGHLPHLESVSLTNYGKPDDSGFHTFYLRPTLAP